MIDKNELLKLLPKLIREDDEIKGAIITALSGVVATKDDIARIIENSNRRFEEINKRFEQAAKEREDIRESMIILRETVGEFMEKELIKRTGNLEKDIKEGNNEIMDYLKEQFEE